jgi:hypothetical protein
VAAAVTAVVAIVRFQFGDPDIPVTLSRMATHKNDAKTVEALAQEQYNSFIDTNRQRIEEAIRSYGQAGFTISLLLHTPKPFHWFPDYAAIGRKAFYDVLEEYRAAGWRIDYNDDRLRNYTTIDDVRFY